jgi:hypothetical protein
MTLTVPDLELSCRALRFIADESQRKLLDSQVWFKTLILIKQMNVSGQCLFLCGFLHMFVFVANSFQKL